MADRGARDQEVTQCLSSTPGTPSPTAGLQRPPTSFTSEDARVPRHELPAGEMRAEVAYQIIHDELMLDGNARLNLATFVTTWMEPQADS